MDIKKDDLDRLIDAIKHPVVQGRQLEQPAIDAVNAYTLITNSLRTVFEVSPSTSSPKQY